MLRFESERAYSVGRSWELDIVLRSAGRAFFNKESHVALDRNGKTVVAGNKGTWSGLEGELKVVSVMELGSNSRLEVCREGEPNKRHQILAASFTKSEDKRAENKGDEDTEVEVPPAA